METTFISAHKQAWKLQRKESQHCWWQQKGHSDQLFLFCQEITVFPLLVSNIDSTLISVYKLISQHPVHSLVNALVRYENVKFVFIAPDELKMPDYLKDEISKIDGVSFIETDCLESAIKDLDVLYMTRVQKERFFNEADYVRLKDSYILDMDKLSLAKDDLIIMHPLPRVNEISREVDDDPRACYFKQVENGKIVRKALMLKLLEVEV